MKPDDMMSVPIRGTYVVDRRSGEIVSRQLEYENLPTKAVAEFLLARFGLNPEDLQQNKSPASIAAKPGESSS